MASLGTDNSLNLVLKKKYYFYSLYHQASYSRITSRDLHSTWSYWEWWSGDTWHVTHDMWHVTCDRGHIKYDRWQLFLLSFFHFFLYICHYLNTSRNWEVPRKQDLIFIFNYWLSFLWKKKLQMHPLQLGCNHNIGCIPFEAKHSGHAKLSKKNFDWVPLNWFKISIYIGNIMKWKCVGRFSKSL